MSYHAVGAFNPEKTTDSKHAWALVDLYGEPTEWRRGYWFWQQAPSSEWIDCESYTVSAPNEKWEVTVGDERCDAYYGVDKWSTFNEYPPYVRDPEQDAMVGGAPRPPQEPPPPPPSREPPPRREPVVIPETEIRAGAGGSSLWGIGLAVVGVGAAIYLLRKRAA